MKEREISVVIPCYNDGKYLPETLTRLKSQSFQDFEARRFARVERSLRPHEIPILELSHAPYQSICIIVLR